jgi:hypothetical protein
LSHATSAVTVAGATMAVVMPVRRKSRRFCILLKLEDIARSEMRPWWRWILVGEATIEGDAGLSGGSAVWERELRHLVSGFPLRASSLGAGGRDRGKTAEDGSAASASRARLRTTDLHG